MTDTLQVRHGGGAPGTRHDGRLKVTGAAQYSAEFALEGLVHGVVVCSTVARGRARRVDAADAEALPGVLAVFSPERPLPAPGALAQESVLDRTLHLISGRTVDHSGQSVALAVAETLEAAVEAASLVRVDYDVEEAVTDFDAVDPVLPEFFFGGPSRHVRGDLDRGAADADVIVEETYTTPLEHHTAMEPHAVIAAWEGARLTLYEPAQGVVQARERIAQVLDIDPDDTRIVARFVGGGFGSKGSVWDHTILAALAARELGRPVSIALDRRQMFELVGHRARTAQRVTLGASRDGALTLLRHDTTSSSATHDSMAEPAGRATPILYAVDNLEVVHRTVTLNMPAPTFMRAPGEAPGMFAVECAMDELALALGIDPIALRVRNHADVDPEDGRPWSSKSLRECYVLGAERFGWAARDPRPRSMRRDGQLVGYGMATATYPAFRAGASAVVRLLPDGSAVAEIGATDIGTGTYTLVATVAAEALAIPAERVAVEIGDSRLPAGAISGGSQGATSNGAAVFSASVAALRRAIDLAVEDPASPLYGAREEDVIADEGRLVLVSDPRRSDTVAALLERQSLPMLEGRADSGPTEEAQRWSMHAFGAQFAEVTVDPQLGITRVTRFCGCFGVGAVLSPVTARSQLVGGIVGGIGQALTEESVMDARTGRIVTRDLADYHVPVSADVPDIDILWVDEDDPYISEVGAKGVGEIAITGVAAAIANAVYQATGVRVRDLPITVDKLLPFLSETP